MAAALETRLQGMNDEAARDWALTDTIRAGISERVEGARVHGHATQRVPHLVCFSVPDLDAEIMSMALDDRGFRIAAAPTAPVRLARRRRSWSTWASPRRRASGSASARTPRRATRSDCSRRSSLVADLREVRGGRRDGAFHSSGER